MFELIPLLGKSVNSSCEYFAAQGHKQDGTYPVIPGGSEVFQVNWIGRKSDIRSTLSFHGKKILPPITETTDCLKHLGAGSVPLIYLLLSRGSPGFLRHDKRQQGLDTGGPVLQQRR